MCAAGTLGGALEETYRSGGVAGARAGGGAGRGGGGGGGPRGAAAACVVRILCLTAAGAAGAGASAGQRRSVHQGGAVRRVPAGPHTRTHRHRRTPTRTDR